MGEASLTWTSTKVGNGGKVQVCDGGALRIKELVANRVSHGLTVGPTAESVLYNATFEGNLVGIFLGNIKENSVISLCLGATLNISTRENWTKYTGNGKDPSYILINNLGGFNLSTNIISGNTNVKVLDFTTTYFDNRSHPKSASYSNETTKYGGTGITQNKYKSSDACSLVNLKKATEKLAPNLPNFTVTKTETTQLTHDFRKPNIAI